MEEDYSRIIIMMRSVIALSCFFASWLAGESWHGAYSLNGLEYGSAIASTPDGGLLIGVKSGNYYGYEKATWLLKVDAAGSIVWQRLWSLWGTMGLAISADGTLWVAQAVDGTRDIHLLHLNQDGELLASRKFRLNSTKELGFILRFKVIPDGFLLLGHEYIWPTGPYFAIRLDLNGWPVWSREYEEFIRLSDADIGLGGDYWLSGAEGRRDAMLLRLSAHDGSVQAAFRYPRSSEYGGGIGSIFLSVRQFPDGTLMAVGKSEVGHHLSDSWVIRLGGDASLQSYKVAGWSASAAIIHPDGYAVIGYSFPYWSWRYTGIVAVSPEKGLLWSSQYFPGWEAYSINQLTVDSQGRIAFIGGGSFWSDQAQEELIAMATAGRFEPDGTVPGCGFQSTHSSDSDALTLGMESVSVPSNPLPIEISSVDVEIANASGTADICRSTGNHRRPLSPP